MKPIPIEAARHIAETYGYDQVIVIARKVDETSQAGGEHCTTYGVDKANCAVAARIGDFLKHKVMGWAREHAWPFGCVKQSSCARHKACMYGCPWHSKRNISGEVDAETERRGG